MSRSLLALKDFQQDGLDFLLSANGCAILADDTGTGKTIQTLAYLNQAAPSRVVVIAPSSVLYQWAEQVERWTGYQARVITSSDQLPPIAAGKVDIFTWDEFQKRLDNLIARRYHLLVADEAHRAKGSNTQRTKALMRLARSTQGRIFLTATPIPNNRSELWPLLNMVAPARWPNLYAFKAQFDNDNRGAAGWRVKNQADLLRIKREVSIESDARLAAAIKPWFLRRLKNEVLPELGTPQVIRYVGYGGDSPYMQNYLEAETDLIRYLERHGLPTKGAKAAPALVKLGELRRLLGLIKTSLVVEKATDMLEDPAKQVVIYAIHQPVIRELSQAFHGVDIIDGGTSAKLRKVIRDRFQAGESRVVVLSAAGEEGIDLYAAQDILFVERPWTADAEAQAIGRLHRIGQGGRVTAHIPLVKGTIDRRLDNIIERKRQMKRSVIGESEYEVTTELLSGLLDRRKED